MTDTLVPFIAETCLVRIFSFYIHDSRYSVPTLKLVQAPDEAEARRKAQVWLDESDHHQAIEVVEDEQPLFQLP